MDKARPKPASGAAENDEPERERVSTGLHCELDLSKPLRQQIQEQFDKFITVFGFEPSHLDLHKLVDNKQAITEVVNFAKEHRLPVRNMGVSGARQTSQPAISAKKHCFEFEELKEVIRRLKDGESYELVTHPGAYDLDCKSSLNREREIDYNNIIKIQDFLKKKEIVVVSYRDL